jgi:hypothetical protein
MAGFWSETFCAAREKHLQFEGKCYIVNYDEGVKNDNDEECSKQAKNICFTGGNNTDSDEYSPAGV